MDRNGHNSVDGNNNNNGGGGGSGVATATATSSRSSATRPHLSLADDGSSETSSAKTSVTRGSQTILTARGLVSIETAGSDEAVPTIIGNGSTSSGSLVGKSHEEAATQATPAYPSASVCLSSARSAREIFRIAASFGSSGSNEIITLTTDYESRTPDAHSLIVHVGNSSTNSVEPARRGERDPTVRPRWDSPPPTVFFEQRRRPIGSRYPRSWIRELFCAREDEVESRHAPPSYAALYQRDPSSNDVSHLPVLLDCSNSRSSFVARTPPPSYIQAQGICVAYSLEQLVSNSDSNGRIWNPRPTTAVCPRCATLVITVVEVRQAGVTHAVALLLCLMGCWLCCMLPYCIDTCKTSHHYCPFCRTYLGTYNP